MLKVEFYVTENGNICGFGIFGHAGYSEHGSDVVCAAVSSAAYMAVNTMTEILRADVHAEINDKLGIMKVNIDGSDISACADILHGLKLHLFLLEDMYPDNIEVNYVEVESDYVND